MSHENYQHGTIDFNTDPDKNLSMIIHYDEIQLMADVIKEILKELNELSEKKGN